MLDSNVILKHLFGEHSISKLLALTEPYYNDIVYSEVLYLLIRNETGEGLLHSREDRNSLGNPLEL